MGNELLTHRDVILRIKALKRHISILYAIQAILFGAIIGLVIK